MNPWLLRRSFTGTLYASDKFSRLRHHAIFSKPLLDLQRRALTLRPYQEECIESVLEGLKRGCRRLGISLATGAGKTVIFSRLIGRIEPRDEDATRTLILVHRRELVLQAYRHCQDAYPDLKVEIDMGNMHATGEADITVASVMSLQRARLDNYDPKRFKLVLIDEVHHAVSQSYLKVLSHFGLVSSNVVPDTAAEQPSKDKSPADAVTSNESAPALVGVSATFSRFDGLSLGHVIDELVYHKDYIDLIDESWLSDVCFTTARFRADLSRVKTHAEGDFVTSSLSATMNTDEINELVIRTWLEKAEDRKTTLVFAVDVAHVDGLETAFRERGVDARSVTAKTPLHQRAATIEAFRAGAFPVLLNCGIFTEGTDIPNIDCVLLARPTKSRNLLVQMIGRGMRLHPGKHDCHVIDMVSALKTGIVSVPTLFGLDPTTLLDKEDVSELRTFQQQSGDLSGETSPAGSAHSDVPQSVTGTGSIRFKEYGSVVDLLLDERTHLHLRQISKNAWEPVGPDKDGNERWILSGSNGCYLRITDRQSTTPRFEVSFLYKLPPWAVAAEGGGSRYSRPQKVAYAQTLDDALHAADTYASDGSNSKRFPTYIVEARQKWRTQPATEAQIRAMKKMINQTGESQVEDMTAGQVASMITRIKHGAKGRFKSIMSQNAKIARQASRQEMERKMREREEVKVGPLS